MVLLCTCSHIMDSRLNQICETILLYEIDVDVVIPLLEMATYYSSDRLQKFCFDYLTKNFAQVYQKEEFQVIEFFICEISLKFRRKWIHRLQNKYIYMLVHKINLYLTNGEKFRCIIIPNPHKQLDKRN